MEWRWALDQHEEALAAYHHALQLRPDYPEALNNLGTTLEALHRPANAPAVYQRALKLQPDRSEWCGNVGNVPRSLGQIDAAEAAYRQAVALSLARPQAQPRNSCSVSNADRRRRRALFRAAGLEP